MLIVELIAHIYIGGAKQRTSIVLTTLKKEIRCEACVYEVEDNFEFVIKTQLKHNLIFLIKTFHAKSEWMTVFWKSLNIFS